MDEFEMKSRINGYIKEISHYSQMQVFATSYYQKNYFQMQIDEAANGLVNLYMDSAALPEKRVTKKNYVPPDLPKEAQSDAGLQQEHPQPGQGKISQPAQRPQPEQQPQSELRRFTMEELAYYDGTGGKPAYVAANGVVYDVTNVKLWECGNHYGKSAGKDLTVAFMGCHLSMPGVLQRIPKVGILE